MTVSVIIPAYNQAQYLRSAIESVIAQTCTDWELIVVNDGSTDSTAQVLSDFENEKRLKAIHQDNQGLAAARNTGIHAAVGHHVALLDSDDAWQPEFLETMLATIALNPAASVFYCVAQCMDESGSVLPQRAGANAVTPDQMYQTLLNANFIIPSTVVINRRILLEAGSFDASRPEMHGCEDWDLWLRLASSFKFAGISKPLVRYRLHDASMSADTTKMERAVLSVVEKHFGLDDRQFDTWTPDKRKAYGGYYRYAVLARILKGGDWEGAAPKLAKALSINSSLAVDLDLFYDLALGEQPIGWRGGADHLDLPLSAARLTKFLEMVFVPPQPALRKLKAITMSTAYWCLGLAAYNIGKPELSRQYLSTAVRLQVSLLINGQFMGTFVRSLIPAVARVRLGNKRQRGAR
jgi:glycosyltransferase involved in cell wall biosynthesis